MYTKILFACSLLKEHKNLAEEAAQIAKRFDATLYLLHVIELPTSLQLAQGLGFIELAKPVKDDAETVLALLGETLHIPKERQFVEVGSVKEHLFTKAKSLGCQLIIMGNHAGSNLHPFLGSTAHAVLNHAPCDILTLKQDLKDLLD